MRYNAWPFVRSGSSGIVLGKELVTIVARPISGLITQTARVVHPIGPGKIMDRLALDVDVHSTVGSTKQGGVGIEPSVSQSPAVGVAAMCVMISGALMSVGEEDRHATSLSIVLGDDPGQAHQVDAMSGCGSGFALEGHGNQEQHGQRRCEDKKRDGSTGGSIVWQSTKQRKPANQGDRQHEGCHEEEQAQNELVGDEVGPVEPDESPGRDQRDAQGDPCSEGKPSEHKDQNGHEGRIASRMGDSRIVLLYANVQEQSISFGRCRNAIAPSAMV